MKQMLGAGLGAAAGAGLLSGCLGTGTVESLVTAPDSDDSFRPAPLETSGTGVPASSLSLYCCTIDGYTHGHQVPWMSAVLADYSASGTLKYSGFSGLGLDQLGSREKLLSLAALGGDISVIISSGAGSTTHFHRLVLTAAQLQELAAGRFVRGTTSNANLAAGSHEHTVVLGFPHDVTV